MKKKKFSFSKLLTNLGYRLRRKPLMTIAQAIEHFWDETDSYLRGIFYGTDINEEKKKVIFFTHAEGFPKSTAKEITEYLRKKTGCWVKTEFRPPSEGTQIIMIFTRSSEN